MLQGPFEPYKDKSPIQAGMSAFLGSTVFGLMFIVLPSYSRAWMFVGLTAGSAWTILAVLSKMESTKNNLWIKFSTSWIFSLYLLMISMRPFSYFFSSDLLGVELPIGSFILVAVAAHFKVLENIPTKMSNPFSFWSERVNKIALTIVSTAGVLGVSFGMFMARTGQVQSGLLVMGIISYILSLGIAYPLFSQFTEAREKSMIKDKTRTS